MAARSTLGLAGFDRDDELVLRKQFESAAVPGWTLVAEADAGVLLIDLDSMYGQMAWLKAQGGSRPIIALTAAGRADTDYVLTRPITVDGLRAVLLQLGGGAAPATAPSAPAATRAPDTPGGATPQPAAPHAAPGSAAPVPAAPVPAAAPPAAPRRRLHDLLHAGTLPGAVRLKNAEPPLLIDSNAGTYVGGTSLKPLVEHCRRELSATDWQPVDASEYARQAGLLGGTQPLARLRWLAALHAFDGQPDPALAGASRFKLSKWLQSEREYPKHFRIATAMLKQPCSVDELAAGSGASTDEVVDFINACHSIGLVESDLPAATEAKGGLMSRLRGR